MQTETSWFIFMNKMFAEIPLRVRLYTSMESRRGTSAPLFFIPLPSSYKLFPHDAQAVPARYTSRSLKLFMLREQIIASCQAVRAKKIFHARGIVWSPLL